MGDVQRSAVCWLWLLTETGILGTSFLFLVLFNALRCAIRIYRHAESSPWQQAMAMTLIAYLISYFVNGMFHDVSIIPMAHMLMFYLIGINTAINQQLPYPAANPSAQNRSTHLQWDQPNVHAPNASNAMA